MIIIYMPNQLHTERRYIVNVIFSYFWDLAYQIVFEDRKNVLISLQNKSIILNDSFFSNDTVHWKKSSSLPDLPLDHFRVRDKNIKGMLVNEDLPIIYGNRLSNNDYLKIDENTIEIGIDIIGSAFFMLTRYEEVVNKNVDEYGRFCSRDSVAYKENFLERPIINEYLEILWYALKILNPDIKRKERKFKIIPTHDVDKPFDLPSLTWYQVFHSLVGDILKRKDVKLFSRRFYAAIRAKLFGNYESDIAYTFSNIMDISEYSGLKSIFFFMVAKNVSEFDGNYDINSTKIQNLIKEIMHRKHYIGMHPSFSSYLNEKQMYEEKNIFTSLIKDKFGKNYQIGSRQHYLRWSCPETWQIYEDVGIKFDTTLTYADHIGFRCGICYEYPVFNLITGKRLNLIEYPLIIMECSGLDSSYMNLSREEMLTRSNKLKKCCQKYEGNFIILWHNTMFIRDKDVELYKKILLE